MNRLDRYDMEAAYAETDQDRNHGVVWPVLYCRCAPHFEMPREPRCTQCQRPFHPACSVCEGEDHHWMPDCPEDEDNVVMVCKHCDASRPMTDEELDSDDL